MRARRTLRVGTGLAAVAVGLLGAGCFVAPPPPAAPARLSVVPSVLSFTAPAGGAMPTLTVTVTNTGGRSARSLAASPVDVYSLPQPAGNPCQGPGASGTLAPGQSCVIDVQFCPSVVGPDNQTLVVTGVDATSGGGLLAGVTLNGTAT
jgi:hypothetical protein